MNLTDLTNYLPNIFGHAPAGVEGLLGSEKTQELNRQANVSGLLGTAMALAVGMSPGGYRRSAAQNILGAIGSGVGAAQGQYQGAIDLMGEQAKIAKANAEAYQAAQKQSAIESLANQITEPDLQALARIDPVKAAEVWQVRQEQKRIDQMFNRGNAPMGGNTLSPVVPNQQSVPQEGTQIDGENVLGAVPVTANALPPDFTKQLLAEKAMLMRGIANLSGDSSKAAMDRSNFATNRIKAIDEQLGNAAVSNYDIDADLKLLPKDGQDRILGLKHFLEMGVLAPKDFISQRDAVFKDYKVPTAEYRNYQLGVEDPKFAAYQEKMRKAGASSTNVYTGDLSKTTQSKVEDQVLSMGDAMTRLNDIQSTYRPEYQNLKFKFAQSWSSLKDKFGLLSPADKNTLGAYSIYKQNATQNLNQTIKDLTGSAMGENEANRIISTLPNAGTDAFSGDSPTEFEAKLGNAIAQTKYAIARKNYALKNGLKWQSITLDSMPDKINQRGAQIAKEYGLDPKNPAHLNTINRQLSAEFGISF